MEYRGKVINGVVVLEGDVRLSEGTSVTVVAAEATTSKGSEEGPTWGEVLRDVIGKAEGLPSDMARNHDHYIHGAPKK